MIKIVKIRIETLIFQLHPTILSGELGVPAIKVSLK